MFELAAAVIAKLGWYDMVGVSSFERAPGTNTDRSRRVKLGGIVL